MWTREEEFTWAYFLAGRPVIEIRAGVRKDGTLAAWECLATGTPGASALATPY